MYETKVNTYLFERICIVRTATEKAVKMVYADLAHRVEFVLRFKKSAPGRLFPGTSSRTGGLEVMTKE